ncbi:MAG: ATP-binding protein [Nanoarchaeota archaeon]
MDRETLRHIVIQQRDWAFRKEVMVRRDVLGSILEWFDDKRIIILTGVRRSGKSTILRQLMSEKKGYSYVSFEDERFIDFKAQDFEMLNESLIEVYGDAGLYFFDEIQNIDKFETFVRRLQDQGKKVVITGSNASLLSKELGTRLTGRYKSFEVYPFSFSEFLRFRGVMWTKDWFFLTPRKVELARLFDEYLLKGGFPEYLKNGDIDYVRTIYENIIYRDIIARYSIKRQRILKELVGILASNISAKITYNSLKETLGLSNAVTVKEYVSYLSNSYMVFEVPRFDYSLRRQLASPKKIYLVDPSFHQVAAVSFSDDKGRVMENLVFLELKRRKKEVYYFSGESECDFIVKDGKNIEIAIQVCYKMDASNKEREIAGLREAMESLDIKRGIILTRDLDEEMIVGRKKVKVMSVWRWLLSG